MSEPKPLAVFISPALSASETPVQVVLKEDAVRKDTSKEKAMSARIAELEAQLAGTLSAEPAQVETIVQSDGEAETMFDAERAAKEAEAIVEDEVEPKPRTTKAK